jgi:hypothetical protein
MSLTIDQINSATHADAIKLLDGIYEHSPWVADQALAAWGAAMGAGHVRLGPGLINEDEAGRVDPPLVPPPALTLGGDVRPALLGGVQAFF